MPSDPHATIKFLCACGQKLCVPAAMAGKSGKCPKCKRVVPVPSQGPAEEIVYAAELVEEAPPQRPAPARVAPRRPPAHRDGDRRPGSSGLPAWAIVLIVLGALAVVGGGVAVTAIPSLNSSRVGANEISAQAALKQLVSTEGVWRQIDADRNGCQDYWTRDVSGFYYCQDAGGSALKFIDISLANADRPGLSNHSEATPRDKSGYWLRVMKTDEDGQAYASNADGDGHSSTNWGKYAFCAFPAEYGKTGLNTFIVNQEGVIYRKDLGSGAGSGCDTWPAVDPMTQGWAPTE